MSKTVENESFFIQFAQALGEAANNDLSDNYDDDRFGVKPRGRELILRMARLVGLTSERSARQPVQFLAKLLKDGSGEIEWLYAHLADRESRALLVSLMAYRALGYRKVRLPLNDATYRSRLNQAERLLDRAQSTELGINGWKAFRADLSPIGYNVKIFTRAADIFSQFMLQQYRCVTADGILEARQGATVLDCGGCYGDTALYFATKSGDEGRVFSFEFLPENVAKFRHNLDLNPGLAERITLVEQPLWNASDQRLYVEGHGSGTRVSVNATRPDAKQVTTIAIDDLVQRQSLDRVDLIKMDIEGAELEALRGATETLRQFKPDLAISVYHQVSDFWNIPRFIADLQLGYEFYLRHFTIHSCSMLCGGTRLKGPALRSILRPNHQAGESQIYA